ncbi:uncharacterized protein LOC5500903 [Nematostella vectensis]|uniref:uncharacterized protein LOC5500903 n=1 Tax=Nematostella vectensis TaxID=45351 RepID=UPI00138FA834|nr:uncharacterized protein LOC5500903 [Nematostella vectensis]
MEMRWAHQILRWKAQSMQARMETQRRENHEGVAGNKKANESSFYPLGSNADENDICEPERREKSEETRRKRIPMRALVKMKLLGRKTRTKYHSKENKNQDEENKSEKLEHGKSDRKMEAMKQYVPLSNMGFITGTDEDENMPDNVDYKGERRRMAICEELEREIFFWGQDLYTLRSLLVVQYKLNGFGLL